MNITRRLPAINDYERSVLENVEAFEWHCTSVTPEQGSSKPPFSYTVGLYYSYQKPEFIIFGLNSEVSNSILGTLADAAASNTLWPLNLPCEALIEGYSCAFVEVPKERRNDYVFSALWFYAEQAFPLYQVVWPDASGRFPWNEAASAEFKAEQPVLGSV